MVTYDNMKHKMIKMPFSYVSLCALVQRLSSIGSRAWLTDFVQQLEGKRKIKNVFNNSG